MAVGSSNYPGNLLEMIYTAEVKSLYAIEVARRQADGTWRWLIGDPYAVSRHVPGGTHVT